MSGRAWTLAPEAFSEFPSFCSHPIPASGRSQRFSVQSLPGDLLGPLAPPGRGSHGRTSPPSAPSSRRAPLPVATLFSVWGCVCPLSLFSHPSG